MERMARIVPALGGALLLAISSHASAQDSSLPPGYTPNWVATPITQPATSLRAALRAALSTTQFKTYPDTSLTSCPKGEKLDHFFYYQDVPEFSGSSWCGAAQANVKWANDTDTLTWRLPYEVDSCQAGVSWAYSHSYQNGTRYHSPPIRGIGMVCMPDECPVAPMTEVTDPETLEYISGDYKGNPNLEQVNPVAVQGAQCIVRAARALKINARISSGYRPQKYQDWLREIWAKSSEIEGNTSDACKERRQQLLELKKARSLEFAPAPVSRHSSGNAVDIGGIPNDKADALASQCGMVRRVAGDRVHFEPR